MAKESGFVERKKDHTERQNNVQRTPTGLNDAVMSQTPFIGANIAHAAAILSSGRQLQSSQRRTLATHIGRHQGNGYFQQMVAEVHRGPAISSDSSSKQKLTTNVTEETMRPSQSVTRPKIGLLPVPQQSYLLVQRFRNPFAAIGAGLSGLGKGLTSGVKKVAAGVQGGLDTAKKFALNKAAEFAQAIPGYSLLTTILGKDPISDQEVPRTATNLVRGVLQMVPGGDKLFKNLEDSNTLQAAFDWLHTQFAQLKLTWSYVKGLFSRVWSALSATDYLMPWKAFGKVKDIFTPLIIRLKHFVVAAANKIWEMALAGAMQLFGPGAGKVLGVLKQAGAAFKAVIRDPIGFLANLIRGVGQGFLQFSTRILQHLKNGFVAWLIKAGPGLRLQVPDDIFSLSGIFSLVTQILGLTWEYVRKKAVRLLGERVVAVAERAFEPFVILINEGPGGLWKYLQSQLSSMAEMVIGQVKDLMITQAIQAGIKWVMGLLTPVGALVKAAKAIYDIVMFVVDRAGQIGEFVRSVMNSIAAISKGAVGRAAALIERSLVRAFPLVIGLLANLAGLGGMAKKVMGIFKKARVKIDGVITKLIGKVKRLFGRSKGKDVKKVTYSDKERRAGLAAFAKAEKPLAQNGTISHENAVNVALNVKRKYRVFKNVKVVDGGDSWDYQYIFRMGNRVRTKSKKKTWLSRPDWTVEVNEKLRTLHPHEFESFIDHKTGKKKYRLKPGTRHRRHIIPVSQVQQHYREFLSRFQNRQMSSQDARNLLRQKMEKQKIPAEMLSRSLNSVIIQRALTKLWRSAFRDTENIWVGDGKQNLQLGDSYYDSPHTWDRAGKAERDRRISNLISRFKGRWFFW